MSTLSKGLALCAALCCALGASVAQASCPTEGAAIFPSPGSVIPTNARFILEGLGPDQATVNALVGRRLVLQSHEDRVGVRVRRGWRSPVNRLSVMLVPSRKLRPNRTYHLKLPSRLKGLKWVDADEGGLSWRTGPGPDHQKPKWHDEPTMSEGEYAMQDGRVVRRVRIHLVAADQSPTYLVITLRAIRGSTGVQVYFAPIDGETAVLGQDGCTGNFALENNGVYQARAKIVDIAGNATRANDFAVIAPHPQG